MTSEPKHEITLAKVRWLSRKHNFPKDKKNLTSTPAVKDLTGGWRANEYARWLAANKPPLDTTGISQRDGCNYYEAKKCVNGKAKTKYLGLSLFFATKRRDEWFAELEGVK